MVFIIRELHSYMFRVQKEMQASFVWLFQQVFKLDALHYLEFVILATMIKINKELH
ncbi:hypothetical protein D8674_018369 [Pyrus ussuriensis x Pyrus communis]|uniref:Uncharacterized protein n=1 Tax=Pyrus ussuriensis x Pyrus communis TaxID=2448454 RepID=A0A5N5G582_9ROSA|nr:hypothetical protein D8674_018369 [Pyrus ussuriensis x Pyrus communis]